MYSLARLLSERMVRRSAWSALHCRCLQWLSSPRKGDTVESPGSAVKFVGAEGTTAIPPPDRSWIRMAPVPGGRIVFSVVAEARERACSPGPTVKCERRRSSVGAAQRESAYCLVIHQYIYFGGTVASVSKQLKVVSSCRSHAHEIYIRRSRMYCQSCSGRCFLGKYVRRTLTGINRDSLARSVRQDVSGSDGRWWRLQNSLCCFISGVARCS